MINSLLPIFLPSYEYYLWTLTFADKRVVSWPLMSSPMPTLALCMGYLTFVLWGKFFMQFFNPLPVRLLVIIHNFFMVALNVYIVLELFIASYKAGYNYICQPVNYSDDPLEVRIAAALWWFYVSKLLEFLDTVFFILRKNFHQVTFLHVYHHVSMFALWWIGIKWVAGGSAFWGAMINAFVHVWMYSYYLHTALFPGRTVGWKKYLTILQLSQFFIAIVHTSYGLYIHCPFPRWMGYTLIGYACSLTILFLNFWTHAYRTKQKTRDSNKNCADVANGALAESKDTESKIRPLVKQRKKLRIE